MVYLPTFTYIYLHLPWIFLPNVGKYTIHGMGNDLLFLSLHINYPLSHNPGSGNMTVFCKGNYYWGGGPFFTSMIMGGRVMQHV